MKKLYYFLFISLVVGLNISCSNSNSIQEKKEVVVDTTVNVKTDTIELEDDYNPDEVRNMIDLMFADIEDTKTWDFEDCIFLSEVIVHFGHRYLEIVSVIDVNDQENIERLGTLTGLVEAFEDVFISLEHECPDSYESHLNNFAADFLFLCDSKYHDKLNEMFNESNSIDYSTE